jgi:hypothetical protein
MIENLITKSRNSEVNTAVDAMIGAFKKTTLSTNASLLGIITQLETKNSELSAAIKRIKAQSELEVLDEVCDQKLRDLWHLVMGALHHPDVTINTAAAKINTLLKNYGLSIVNESYATESAHIKSLLTDLAAEDLQDALTTVSGCTELIGALTAAQSDFEAARIQFEEDKAHQGTFDNATLLKKSVVELVNKQFIVLVNGLAVGDNETYGSYASTVEQIINDNNVTVRKRMKKPDVAVA